MRDPGAAAFGSPRAVSPLQRLPCCTAVAAAIGERGDAVLTWRSTLRPAAWAALRAAGERFRPPQRLAPESSDVPRAAIGADGTAAVIYSSQRVPLRPGDGLRLHRAPSGGPFGAAEIVNPGGGVTLGNVTVTRAGRTAVAWIEPTAARVRLSEAGPRMPLGAGAVLGADAAPRAPVVAADDDGRTVVAWTARAPSRRSLDERVVAATRSALTAGFGAPVALGAPWPIAAPRVVRLSPGGWGARAVDRHRPSAAPHSPSRGFRSWGILARRTHGREEDQMAVDRELGAGAWSYFGDPRAISHDGHTFTGWISTTGNVWVARYTRGGKLSKRLIFRGLGRDDHNNPSLVFRRDGHLMVFFSPHSGHHLPPPGIPSVMRYMVALHRHSIQEFGRVRTVPTNVPGGLGYTYPNPIQLRDKLWLFWRGGGWNPTFSYTEDGHEWVPARELVRSGGGARPYAKYVGDGDRRIHAIFSNGNAHSTPSGLHYLRYEAGKLFAVGGRRLGTLRRRAAAHLRARPHLPLHRAGWQRLAARHRAHLRGPAADRLHAAAGRPGHLLLRVPQRRPSGSAARSSRRGAAASTSGPAGRRSTTRTRASSTSRERSAHGARSSSGSRRTKAGPGRRDSSPRGPTGSVRGRSRRAACAAPTASSTGPATSARPAGPSSSRASTRWTSERRASSPPAQRGEAGDHGCRSDDEQREGVRVRRADPPTRSRRRRSSGPSAGARTRRPGEGRTG